MRKRQGCRKYIDFGFICGILMDVGEGRIFVAVFFFFVSFFVFFQCIFIFFTFNAVTSFPFFCFFSLKIFSGDFVLVYGFMFFWVVMGDRKSVV